MKTTMSACIMIVLLLIGHHIQAQSINSLKNSLGKQLERKAKRTIDKTLDKGIDKTGEKFEERQDRKKAAKFPTPEDLYTMEKAPEDEPLTAKQVGSFETFTYVYENERLKTSKPPKSMIYIDYLHTAIQTTPNDDHTRREIHCRKAAALYTLEQKGNQKAGMRVQLPPISDEETFIEDHFTVTETSIKKTIKGFPCVKYTVDSQDFEGEIWMTKEVPVELYESYMPTFMITHPDAGNLYLPDMAKMEGFPVQIVAENKNGKDKYITYNLKATTERPGWKVYDADGFEIKKAE